jgi:hypothetical protein
LIYPEPAAGGFAVFTTKLTPAVFVVTIIHVGIPGDTYSHERRITEFAVMFAFEIVVLLVPLFSTRPQLTTVTLLSFGFGATLYVTVEPALAIYE